MKSNVSYLFIIFFSVFVNGQTTLAYNLQKDAVYRIKQDAHQVITQILDGTQHEITNDIDGILEFKVVGKNDEGYLIVLNFKDLNLTMSSSLQGELMNVKAKAAIDGDMQSQIFHSMLDTPVEMTLSKTGAILRVEGGDSLVAKMARASGLTDEISLQMMKTSLEKEFGSEALSNNYEQMTFFYPENRPNVGDTWENEYLGKLNAKNKWTLNSVSPDKAEISGIAAVVMDVSEPTTTMKLSGTQITEITTDVISGFVQTMKVVGVSEGMATMAQLGNQEIPTTIKSIITYQLIN